MRQVKEVLRQKWVLRRSHREIGQSIGLSVGTITNTLGRARQAGLDWAMVQDIGEVELERQLYGPILGPGVERPQIDPAFIHQERRRAGVTLQLLHLEYLEEHPDGYRYSQFCEHYRQWLRRQRPRMRQIHKAGEKLFVDYSGKKPSIVDPQTGEVTDVEFFVAVMGASNYTYAEATRTQKVHDWIASHVRALNFLGGVPGALVPDQLKSGVSRACRYEPGIQRNYQDLAEHYGTVVLPARPAKPRDKAKAEVGVQIAQRWILARLRNQTFFSLDELNERIAELLEELNDRTMRQYKASRRELFARYDQPMLKPLPAKRFVYARWAVAKVNIDYHFEVDRHYYSVPFCHLGEKVDVRISSGTVEAFLHNERIAAHSRSFRAGHHTTDPDHMPKSHREQAEWTPSRFIRWAEKTGPQAAALVTHILETRRHPEQGYRSCMGILRLSKRYETERLEAACGRSLRAGGCSYRSVEEILKNGLDRLEEPPDPQRLPLEHENVRGADYYAKEDTSC